MHVVPMGRRPCRESIAVLQHLLALAHGGDLRGLAVCAKDSTGFEHIAFAGEYLSDPAKAVNAANRMSWRLTQMQDERDSTL